MLSRDQWYVYWSNEPYTYWVCDREDCRLAGRLEGETLYRRTDGDSQTCPCRVCKQPLYKGEVHASSGV